MVVKGENAGYQHFLLFPLCFPSNQNFISFVSISQQSSADAVNFEKANFFSFGKGFTKQEVYCRYNVYGLQVLPAHVFITSVQSKQTRNALINQTDITPVCCFNLKVGFRFNDDYCIYLLENGQIYCERCRISVGLFRCHGLMMNR